MMKLIPKIRAQKRALLLYISSRRVIANVLRTTISSASPIVSCGNKIVIGDGECEMKPVKQSDVHS